MQVFHIKIDGLTSMPACILAGQFCMWKHFLWGTLRNCAASEVHNVSKPGWGDIHALHCEERAVASCRPMPDPAGLCGQFDFLAGEQPTTIFVPAGGSRDQWLIFETGKTTSDNHGLCV